MNFHCRLYHHIKLPSELRQGHDYAVFKQGIRPMWEDDANKMGGRWLISIERNKRNSDLDRFWLDAVSKSSNFLNDLWPNTQLKK